MFKKIKNFYSNIKTLYKRQSFKDKPIRTLFYIMLMFIYLLFRITKKYKIEINKKKYFYTYKPYIQMGMGGRGQFVLREYYDDFLAYGTKILPKSFNFIDIGCSRGFFTLYLLAHNSKEAKGICIDPFQYALNDLKEVLELNNFSNVEILKGVVSDKIESNIFVRNAKIPSEASIIQRAAYGSDDGFYCKSYTVDQLIYKMNLINNVEFIKIDAEGAEFEILLGSQNTLKNFKPIIYLEVTRKESEIRNLLQNNNYLIYHFLNKNMTVAPENLLHTSILAIPKNYN